MFAKKQKYNICIYLDTINICIESLYVCLFFAKKKKYVCEKRKKATRARARPKTRPTLPTLPTNQPTNRLTLSLKARLTCL